MELHENKLRIMILDDKITQLVEELERCRDERDGRRRFIAPFRRLPHELLCEIALHGLEMGQSPLTLSHVCVASREALSGMKSLWTKIILCVRWSRLQQFDSKYQVSSQYCAHSVLRMVKGYIKCHSTGYLSLLLRRAAALPLTIAIENPTTVYELIEELSLSPQHVQTLHLIHFGKEEGYLSELKVRGLRELNVAVNFPSNRLIDWYLDIIKFSQSNLVKFGLESDLFHLTPFLQHSDFFHVTDMTLRLGEY
jgi:hypothetical protein